MTAENQTTIMVIAVVVILAIVLIALVVGARRRSAQLRDRFGPEYQRTVDTAGDQRKAEADLASRERERQKFQIRPLPAGLREQYLTQWNAVQARVVDDPAQALSDADDLVQQAMEARGYPVGDFTRQTAVLSVDYGDVINNYRQAHGIMLSSKNGAASTEDLRRGMVLYRSLFDGLVEADRAST